MHKARYELFTRYGTKTVTITERSENLIAKIFKTIYRLFKVKYGKLACLHFCTCCPHREQCWRETGVVIDPAYTQVWNSAYDEGFANGYDQGWEDSKR